MSQRRILLSLAGIVILSVPMGLSAPGFARPADKCLARPKLPSAEGEHWYYRVDRVHKRRCWHLASEAEKERKAMRRAKKRHDAPRTAQSKDAPARRSAGPTAAGAGPIAVEPALVLRWPAAVRYSYSEEPAPLAPSPAIAVADASGRGDAIAPAAVTNAAPTAVTNTAPAPGPIAAPAALPSDSVAPVAQGALETHPPQRPDPAVNIRPAPTGDSHVFALMTTAIALFGTLGAIMLAGCLPARPRSRELKGAVWLRESRPDLSYPEIEMPVDLPAAASMRPRTVIDEIQPFEWSRQFAQAWRQLAEETLARNHERPPSIAEQAYWLREGAAREAALPRAHHAAREVILIEHRNIPASNWPSLAASS